MRNPEPARDEGRNPEVTYRGGDLDELLPKIREELGPDAIVVRQREGLDGGVGGFFQRRCVEVVARRATPGVDLYDAQHADEPVAPEPPAPAIQEIMRVASPFIEQLQAAQGTAEPADAPMYVPESFTQPPAVADVAPERAPVVMAGAVCEQPLTGAYGASAYTATRGGAMVLTRPVQTPPVAPPAEPAAEATPPAAANQAATLPEAPAAGAEGAAPEAATPEPETVTEPAERKGAAGNHERTLIAAGIAPKLAADIIDAAVSHIVPFGPTRALKRVLREALARRIPLAPPVAAGGRALAFVGAGGSGKTLCVARLATAYARHSDLDVSVISAVAPERGSELGKLLEPVGVGVLDARAMGARVTRTKNVLTVIDTPAVSPSAAAEVKALAAELKRLGGPEVHVAVPATLSAAAVRRLLDGLAPLAPAAIVLTHLDEVGHAGPVIDEAIARGIAISYTSDGSAEDGFVPADRAALAARVLA